MPLPILQVTRQPTVQTLVRLFHQTEVLWTRHIAEEDALDFGTAFFNPQLGEVPDANRVLGASLPAGITPATAVDLLEAEYRKKGTRPHAWIMNPSVPQVQTQPLVDHLLAFGFRLASSDILYLAHQPALTEVTGLQIIPARASFRHARQLADEAAALLNQPQLAEAAMLHLDDPHVDSLLALQDGRAVAGVSVLASGEVGRVENLFVTVTQRRRGIGRAMLSRALEICARSLFKHVMLRCDPQNAAAMSLVGKMGFEKIGDLESYDAPATELAE